MKIVINIFLCLTVFFLSSCITYENKRTTTSEDKIYYSSKGFALIFDETLLKKKIINKKISNDEIGVIHSYLKKNTPVIITNPLNSKSVETKIIKTANYPKIFNIVISEKMSSILSLDVNNPYVEVIEFKKNKKFIAKKSNTYDEEKNVATKAPVDDIEMDNISENKSITEKVSKKSEPFFIIISDFYFIESANKLKEDLSSKVKNNKLMVKKINNNTYRLLIGPFENFNSLKKTYISLNNLGFDDLNIIRN